MEQEKETVVKTTTWAEVSLSIDTALMALNRYTTEIKTRSTSLTRTKLQEAGMWFQLTRPEEDENQGEANASPDTL